MTHLWERDPNLVEAMHNGRPILDSEVGTEGTCRLVPWIL